LDTSSSIARIISTYPCSWVLCSLLDPSLWGLVVFLFIPPLPKLLHFWGLVVH
jgi:hypothetical protein